MLKIIIICQYVLFYIFLAGISTIYLILGFIFYQKTLQVKDEELQYLSRELRVRDSTIKEIADKLIDTAEAAEAAANAARVMDEERTSARAEIKELTKDSEKELMTLMNKVLNH